MAIRRLPLKTPQEVDAYLAWCREGGAIPRLKGYAPFKILMDQGRIAPQYTTMRVMYTGLIDTCYYVNENGFLEQVGVENPISLDPKDILSEAKNPDGWEPEGLLPGRD